MEPPLRQGQPPLGQAKPGRIAAHRRRLNRRAAGITQAQQPGHLVEAFAGGVVAAAAQAPVAAGSIHPHQLGVSAADQQHQIGPWRQRLLAQLGRAQMALQMMHADERLAMQPGQGPAGQRTHQQGPHQPWSHGGRHRIHRSQVDAALGEHLINQRR